jgi:hypothetical protein
MGNDAIESFIWVFAYCVVHGVLHQASKPHAPQDIKLQLDEFRELFVECFGKTTYRSISNMRNSEATTLEFPTYRNIGDIISKHMSEALITLFLRSPRPNAAAEGCHPPPQHCIPFDPRGPCQSMDEYKVGNKRVHNFTEVSLYTIVGASRLRQWGNSSTTMNACRKIV